MRSATRARSGACTRRRGLAAALLLPALLATLTTSGCATLNQIDVEVRTFGSWPAGRAPGRYAFERLPSQQEDAATQEALEAAAGAALERAGFARADSAAQADVLVQFGTRQAQVLKPPPNVSIGIGIGVGSSMWRHGGFGWGLYGHHGIYPDDRLREQRELGLLILDRASHQVLVEVQARHESRYGAGDVAEALFDAALDGFPDLPAGPRKVTVPLPGR